VKGEFIMAIVRKDGRTGLTYTDRLAKWDDNRTTRKENVETKYEIEWVDDLMGLTWDDVGTEKFYKQLHQIVVWNLNEAINCFHNISRDEHTVACQLFSSVLLDGVVILEDRIEETLRNYDSFETREIMKLREICETSSKQIEKYKAFIKKYNAGNDFDYFVREQ
jgi:hypothetical protein